MNVVKDRLTYQQIHVVWPYGSIRLQQLDMLQEWGEHARISIQGSIDPMLAESLLKEASADDNIELWYDDEQGTRCPLFMGQLYDVQVQHAPEEATVHLEIISHSFKLDTEFKNRSFQRVDQQFVEIVDAVLADYPGADKIDEAFGKQATGQFILQYTGDGLGFPAALGLACGGRAHSEYTVPSPSDLDRDSTDRQADSTGGRTFYIEKKSRSLSRPSHEPWSERTCRGLYPLCVRMGSYPAIRG
ncbi:hypothetical protein [Paenibacillus massiliensis]|uniref:hypothetical protein n=1 Tax=Paenibacillus massiliensis TaxID=225917 RepID=UPI0003FFF9A0|nr:hypothetical protein [Paenibacillus massiliensis]